MLGCFDTVRVRVASAASFVLGLGASEGEIIEQGNHNDLISKKGYYYELYQASKKDIID